MVTQLLEKLGVIKWFRKTEWQMKGLWHVHMIAYVSENVKKLFGLRISTQPTKSWPEFLKAKIRSLQTHDACYSKCYSSNGSSKCQYRLGHRS